MDDSEALGLGTWNKQAIILSDKYCLPFTATRTGDPLNGLR
jgi:hypothetical protein